MEQLKTNTKLIALLIVGAVAWSFSHPDLLTPQAWHLFIVVVLTITGVVIDAASMGALCLLSLTILCLTQTLTLNEALSSYGTPVVWLVFFAFCIARGFISTGLGSRIAYFFVSLFGKSTLGLSYSFVVSDLILAPAVPSNTARGAGILFPIIKSLVEEFEGTSHDPSRHGRIGSFLIKVAFQSNVITSAMFVTALAGNPLAVEFAAGMGIDIGWTRWALAALVPGLFMLTVTPLIIYAIAPPKLKQLDNAQSRARTKLQSMGRMSFHEWIMLGTFLFLLVLWIFGNQLGINSALAAMVGIIILLFSGVFKWDDIVKERTAWNTFVWFGSLITLAAQLEKKGVISWFGTIVAGAVTFDSWMLTFFVVVIIYFYTHYFFASTTALISSLFPVFLHVILKAGAPPFFAAITLAVMSTLSAGLTHYGTGTAPVYYATGYVSMRKWWGLGAVLSVFYLVTWFTLGTVWCQFLGLW